MKLLTLVFVMFFSMQIMANNNSCEYARDGICDDGGPGSSYDVCDYGTDLRDCGPRKERRRRKPPRRDTGNYDRCVGINIYGKWAQGGGCNVYGCWYSGGGCNVYGCWEYGGSCNVYGCINEAPKTSMACSE